MSFDAMQFPQMKYLVFTWKTLENTYNPAFLIFSTLIKKGYICGLLRLCQWCSINFIVSLQCRLTSQPLNLQYHETSLQYDSAKLCCELSQTGGSLNGQICITSYNDTFSVSIENLKDKFTVWHYNMVMFISYQ